MRVAIAHDYLTQRGGAERVVIEIARRFPNAPVYTSLYRAEGTFPEFASLDVRTGPLNRLSPLRRDHRMALPLLAFATSATKIDADVVIASSSGWAHGVRTEAPVVVYCYNPARWLYQTDEYLGAGAPAALRYAVRAVRPPLRWWDRRAVASAARFLTISSVVRERIRREYGIDAEVLPPPPGLDPSGGRRAPASVDGERGFLLCVSRLLPYKHVDAVIEAVNEMPALRLVVVGLGPEFERLRSLAGPNVTMLGGVDDEELRWLYLNAGAVIAASHEDFGLTPLEGLQFGKPSVVLRAGGFLDTVAEDETGVFFDRPEPLLIRSAIARAFRTDWDEHVLTERSERYGRARFGARLQEIVDEVAGG